MLVLELRPGRYMNVYLYTPHGRKRLGRIKRCTKSRIGFDFDSEVVVIREEIDDSDCGDWQERKEGK